MTIWLYTGTPGSGKSYHAVSDAIGRLNRKGKKNSLKKRVMTNFFMKSDSPDYRQLLPNQITPDFFYDFALKNHAVGVEGQTLVILDEAGTIFNSRDWGSNSSKRMEWIKFFSMHRHYGYNFILIAQMDRMIDRQIRGLIEYEVAHNKINNYWAMLPISMFLCVERWYGQKLKIGHKVLVYNPRTAKRYNSFAIFEHAKNESNFTHSLSGSGGNKWGPAELGGPTELPPPAAQEESKCSRTDGKQPPAAAPLVAPSG